MMSFNLNYKETGWTIYCTPLNLEIIDRELQHWFQFQGLTCFSGEDFKPRIGLSYFYFATFKCDIFEQKAGKLVKPDYQSNLHPNSTDFV